MIDAGTYAAPNWVDLSSTDVEVAVRFYSDLLGWTVERQDTPMGEYHIARIDGLEVGGMMHAGPEQEGMPSVWTVFFNVADVDATAGVVAEAGGKVLEAPFDIPDGRVAVVADPTGAMFGLITGPRPEGMWLSRTPGAVTWVELLTRDVTAAEAFYASVFGWKAETQDFGGTSYTTFSLDGEPVTGMMTMPDEVPAEAPAHWSVYFAVDDCRAAERRVADLDGMVLRPTMDMTEGSFAVLADPTGATFQVMEYADSP